eukprot:gene1931-2261_t
MVCLTRDELADLLGAEDETCKLLVCSGGLGSADKSRSCWTEALNTSVSSTTSSQLAWGEAWQQRRQQLREQLASALQRISYASGGCSSSSAQCMGQHRWQRLEADIKQFLRECSQEVALKEAQLQEAALCPLPLSAASKA